MQNSCHNFEHIAFSVRGDDFGSGIGVHGFDGSNKPGWDSIRLQDFDRLASIDGVVGLFEIYESQFSRRFVVLYFLDNTAEICATLERFSLKPF